MRSLAKMRTEVYEWMMRHCFISAVLIIVLIWFVVLSLLTSPLSWILGGILTFIVVVIALLLSMIPNESETEQMRKIEQWDG